MARLTPQEALQRIVTTSTKGKKKAKGVVTYKHVRTLGLADDALFVFRRGDTRQHIIATADDRLAPIIADIDDADFDDELPPCLVDWLGEYEREIAWFDTMGDMVSDEDPVMELGRKDVPAILRTTWAQTSPYNAHLVFNGSACKVGCAAVAAGQIMYHWGMNNYKRGCKPVPPYTTATNKYKVEALKGVASFDYRNMTTGTPKTAESKEAVATLLEYVGKVMKSDYTPSGTGVFPAVLATELRQSLKMGKGITIVYASKGAFAFEEAVYEELAEGRPVIMGGYHTGGGHAFVCDGYRVSDGKFHFNWGWGGSFNGWFAMSALNPTAANTYNSNKNAVVGIKPDYILGDVNGDGDIDVTDAMEITQQILGKKPHTESADVNSDGEVTATDQQLLVKQILGK